MTQPAKKYIKISVRNLVIGLLLLLAIGIFLILRPDSQPVDVGTITEGVFQKMIIDDGVTHFQQRRVLTAPSDGIVPEHGLKAGDPIKKGQVLVDFLWDRDFRLAAPFDGYVLKVFEEDRRRVLPGTPILEIGNPDSLEVVVDLLSQDVVDVKIGQRALITGWGKEQPLEARVSKIEKSAIEEVSALGVKEQRVPVHLQIITDPKIWKNLGDGFQVEVQIIVNEAEDARLLPIGALFSKDGEPAVFIINNGRLDLKAVEIGDRNRNYAHLLTDLPVGTKVVLYPAHSLEDGARVHAQN